MNPVELVNLQLYFYHVSSFALLFQSHVAATLLIQRQRVVPFIFVAIVLLSI
jgi:hypothetical protein